MDSYDVRFWDIKKTGSGTGVRFRVRWAVDGREHCKSFKARPLADGFLTGLKDAVRDRRSFNPRTGLPGAGAAGGEPVTWYAHARSYAEAKWPNLAPVSRRSVAEALVTVTVALARKERGAPEAKVLRQALFGWAFNPATRDQVPPPQIATALEWAASASLPLAALEDTATVRAALGACAKTLTGKAASGSMQRRKRSVFYNALGYAVEQGHLTSNPVDRIQWTAPAVAASVDRRVVVSPAQARSLLAAVRGLSERGVHLEAFYGCLYYAALRPSEAVMLRRSDLHLPRQGWGRIVLAASASRAGTAWTDHGTARQERGLKHRAAHETRTIPIPPDLVTLLRAHIKRYGTTPDGRVFQTARGGIIQDSAYSAVWAEARKQALTEAQYRSPLGRRPYDLRHAAVSLWLNSGVPATEVARRAGHGVAVLLKVYAHCIDGQANAANTRIDDALGTHDPQPDSAEEGDEEGDAQAS
ncbi:MAG: tyrosine-type recombinase/integrase [Actinomycetota bacterium]|jgi:integrase|nr:tyrosine-type recombinase/integrase [Actinomycetota bacterium]